MDPDLNITLQSETLNLSEAILERYNVPGPRYTSYPTAPEWNDSFGPEEFQRSLEESNRHPAPPLSLYVHLPFCESLCLFCGCNVVIDRHHEKTPEYFKALKWEINRIADRIAKERPVIQLHWGGGSPTFLSPSQMEDLFGFICERFTLAPDAEIGVEADPRTGKYEHMAALRRLGFNRVSIGIQDFNPQVQQTVHRIQPYEMTREIFDACRALGFESINVDLIYGLPRQTAESFSDTIEKVIDMKPDRVAMFSYAHVPWMKKQQGSFSRHIPLGMDKFRIFRTGIEGFTRAGYVYIGMDHFARPDDELCLAQRNRTLHRNFQGYTTKAGADLLGMGVSSIGGLGRVYTQNFRDLAGYYSAVEKGCLPTMRGIRLSDDDVLRRAVISKILCHCILHKQEIAGEFKIDFDRYFADELARLEALKEDGLVEIGPDTIAVTSLGRIFIRNVGMVFDSYLRKPKERAMFSKTL